MEGPGRTFKDTLNYYCQLLECNNIELAEESGVDASGISRYRSGERIPKKEGENVKNLAHGIMQLALKKGISLEEAEVYHTLSASLSESFEVEQKRDIAEKIDLLMENLEISNAKLASYLNFDPSYLSKIRNGKRLITDTQMLVEKVARYIVRNYTSEEQVACIGTLVGKEAEVLDTAQKRYTAIKEWFFCNEKQEKGKEIGSFMEKLDTFDLNEFIRAIHFDKLKVPTLPFKMYGSKAYYGIEEMKKGELNFFKGAVTSKSKDYVTMYSDMMLADMAQDKEFNKKWMFGLAMLIKKGVKLKIIHCLDRPFEELLFGLEAWVPIYMTGQVEPWYLPDMHSKIFHHFINTSGTSALVGESIEGNRDNAMYYHTFKEHEVSYYRASANQLLSHAKPLMKIYRKEQEAEYFQYRRKCYMKKGYRRGLCSAPPLYTISEELLNQILSFNGIGQEDAARIREKVCHYKQEIEKILESQRIDDEIHIISSDSVAEEKEMLMLSEIFEEVKLFYNKELYEKHLEEIAQFAERHKYYSYSLSREKGFKNIQIHICEGQYVIMSKNNEPVIQFIIENPQLRTAIENFHMMQIEEE